MKRIILLALLLLTLPSMAQEGFVQPFKPKEVEFTLENPPMQRPNGGHWSTVEAWTKVFEIHIESILVKDKKAYFWVRHSTDATLIQPIKEIFLEKRMVDCSTKQISQPFQVFKSSNVNPQEIEIANIDLPNYALSKPFRFYNDYYELMRNVCRLVKGKS